MASGGFAGVGGGLLAQEGVELQLGAVEAARHVEFFGADDDDLLARQNLLGDDGSQTTQQVTLTINDDNLLEWGKSDWG